VQLDQKVVFILNPLLAEILINNLLSNALRHNFEKGKIIISSKDQAITISNTGEGAPMDDSRLFRRFSKQTTASESNGLGLAITHEICKSFNLELSYSHLNEMHSMTIRQKSQISTNL
jgi:signal transduction histidine kinase